MNVLIAYGSIEGQTSKIAIGCGKQLTAGGHSIEILEVSQTTGAFDLSHFDSCLIAAPVHQQRHPDDVINFARAHAAALNAIPCGFVSVSLSAAFPEGQEEANSYIRRFLERTGLEFITTHTAAGAIRYKEYDFFQEQILRHVVLKDRAPADISGDHEFTDWQALDDFVTEFVSAVEQRLATTAD